MPSRKGSHDIASVVRGAFLRAAKQSEDDGRPLSTILLQMLQDDPKGCLDTVAKYVPKEMLIEATVTQQLEELTDEALDREIGRLVAEAAPLSLVGGKEGQAQH